MTPQTLIRSNPRGLSFRLIELDRLNTRIELEKDPQKFIEIPEDLHYISACWGHWLSGHYIQVVFSFLNPDQREFLMTGLSPEEWDRMFSEGPEDQEGSI